MKHLGMILGSRFTFDEYLENVFGKVNKGISIILKLVLPRSALLTFNEPFVRHHLD